MKGVSTSAIFVIVVLGMIIMAGIIVFWRWFSSQKEVSEMGCKAKQLNYCISLINNENIDWDHINPKEGCEKFGIVKPSKEECEKLIK
ncbi:MAG: hypothetical protein QXD89_01095 [Candidatus Aenigmatarchaeota archaeon]